MPGVSHGGDSDGERGGYFTSALVNGVPINFEIDTGADRIFLPWSAALDLIHQGRLKRSELEGVGEAGLADGGTTKVIHATLSSITLGGHTVYNVEADIGEKGSALLGQTFFRHFDSVKIDNARHQLVLGQPVD